MVSISTVNDDKDKLKKIFNNYYEIIDELKSHWKGDSYKNLKKKMTSYCEKNKEPIIQQFEKYKNAIVLYSGYAQLVEEYEKAKKKYEQTKNDEDYNTMNEKKADITNQEKYIKDKLKEIENISIESVSEKKYG